MNFLSLMCSERPDPVTYVSFNYAGNKNVCIIFSYNYCTLWF